MSANKIDFSDDDAKKMLFDHVHDMTPEQIREHFRKRGRDPEALIAQGEKDFSDLIGASEYNERSSEK